MFNFVIRKIAPNGTVSTVAGQPRVRGKRDEIASEAQAIDRLRGHRIPSCLKT
jgi:hypothetical protein